MKLFKTFSLYLSVFLLLIHFILSPSKLYAAGKSYTRHFGENHFCSAQTVIEGATGEVAFYRPGLFDSSSKTFKDVLSLGDNGQLFCKFCGFEKSHYFQINRQIIHHHNAKIHTQNDEMLVVIASQYGSTFNTIICGNDEPSSYSESLFSFSARSMEYDSQVNITRIQNPIARPLASRELSYPFSERSDLDALCAKFGFSRHFKSQTLDTREDFGLIYNGSAQLSHDSLDNTQNVLPRALNSLWCTGKPLKFREPSEKTYPKETLLESQSISINFK